MKYLAQGIIVLTGTFYMIMEQIFDKPAPVDAAMLWAAASLIIVALGVFES